MSLPDESQWEMAEPSQPFMRINADASHGDAFVSEDLQWLDESEDQTPATGDSTDSMVMKFERRAFRRYDVESWGVSIVRCEDDAPSQLVIGRLLDLSAGGVRLRTNHAALHLGQQIKVRLALPASTGLCPFVNMNDGQLQPRHDWEGWMEVARLTPEPDGSFEVGGRLLDMQAMDRGMLGLFLSAQRMAA